MDAERFDHLVVGAGRRGLAAGLELQAAAAGDRRLVVDAAPRAGGAVQTLRSNGFVCELGPFAFAADELAPLLARLPRPPRPIEPLASGRRGHRLGPAGLVPLDVAPLPLSFASGNEELVQACRRELGRVLRLGRAVTAIEPEGAGFAVALGGEAAGRCHARRVTLALPLAASARLLARFDRELATVAARLGDETHAFVFLGGHAADAPELSGYGILPDAGLDTAVAEAIFCTQVFAGRALPGRVLVRLEVVPRGGGVSDEDLLAMAAGELRRWTGTRAPLPFRKVHRFTAPGCAAAEAECRARLRAVATGLEGLAIA
ncbi:MAG: FAD-dependent oxidoreductase [Planctomycetes bacterium]|nr:FAD-dependent oxidoreductase [Planctomycetota bacterium]